MHDPAFERHPCGNAVATGDNSSLTQDLPILGLRCTGRHRHIAVDPALAYCDRREIGAAKPDGRFDHCVEHQLHIGGRARDDFQDVAGRGLIFERFFEVARAGLQFTEQSRVLHRDDRLVGEGAHQFDLPLSERVDPPPRQIDRADDGSLAQQRHPKSGTSPGRHILGHRVIRVGGEVLDMHDPAFERRPAGDAVATGDKRAQDRPILGLRRTERTRHKAIDLALAYCDRSGSGTAKPDGRFDYCVQHRLHIGGRAADDIQHVAGRGLVFERFFEVARADLQLAEQPRVLHRDDRLVGKGADQFNLPLAERLDPLPGQHDNADWLVVAQQRHPECRASPGRHSPGHREVRVSADIFDMNDPAFERHSPGHAVATGANCFLTAERP